jgi:glycosyltransferase involved in cell wall biosynthesis
VKEVLLVAYHYPPDQAVGGVRPAKFTRYLPQLGWTPIVLTAAAQGAGGSRNEIGEIHHVAEWPHPLKWYTRFKEHRLKARGRGDELAAKWSLSYDEAMAPSALRGIVELKRWILAFQWLPDQEIGWIIPAAWRGIRLIRRKRISHMITSGPPSSSYLVGLALKRITGIQWIADFRDPWTLKQKSPLYRNFVTDRVEARLIRSVVQRANLVLSNTAQRTEDVRKENPDLNPEKFITMTNGFDPADFEGLIQKRPVPGPVIFVHPGTFYFGQSPEPFLRALKRLIIDGNVKQNDVLVRFFGYASAAGGQAVPEMVRRLGLEAIVAIEPRVARREALQEILNAHVVLVFSEHIPDRIPFKLYESMAAGALILNIGRAGATAEVLAKTGKGLTVDYRNQEDISQGILEAMARSRSPGAEVRNESWRDPAIQEYNFEVLTSRLAGLLDDMR